MQSKFYNSKTNTFLLLILIILMIIAISIMIKDKATYLPMFEKKADIQDNFQKENLKREVLGNKDDLLSFSIEPEQKVSEKITVKGEIKGGYFFEGNILVNILDGNKQIIKEGYGTATTDWMTVLPVSFTADVDFTNLASGPAYLEIKNDNPSDLRENDKNILIPIIIK